MTCILVRQGFQKPSCLLWRPCRTITPSIGIPTWSHWYWCISIFKKITHDLCISGGYNFEPQHWIWHNMAIWLCQRKFIWETWEIIKSPHHTRRSKLESRLTYISARQVIFQLSHFHFAGSLSELWCFHLKFLCFRKSCTKCLFVRRLIIKCPVFHTNCVSRILSISDLRVIFMFLYLYMFSDLHTMII